MIKNHIEFNIERTMIVCQGPNWLIDDRVTAHTILRVRIFCGICWTVIPWAGRN